MLAQSDVNLKEAAETVYVISQDELIREQMIAREDNIRSEKAMKKHYEDAMEEISRSKKAMEKHYEDEIGELNAAQKNMVKHYEDTISEKDRLIAELKAQLAEK